MIYEITIISFGKFQDSIFLADIIEKFGILIFAVANSNKLLYSLLSMFSGFVKPKSRFNPSMQIHHLFYLCRMDGYLKNYRRISGLVMWRSDGM